jgi:hypothetical protein
MEALLFSADDPDLVSLFEPPELLGTTAWGESFRRALNSAVLFVGAFTSFLLEAIASASISVFTVAVLFPAFPFLCYMFRFISTLVLGHQLSGGLGP